MDERGFTYSGSGVDVGRGDEFSAFISGGALPGWVKRDRAGYASILELPSSKVVVSADGVGSKMMLHRLHKRWRDAALDLVAMNYNDVVAAGGKPIAFMDYLGVGRIDRDLYDFASALKEVLSEVGVALVGGETAEMPDLYGDEMEAVGFCIGVLCRPMEVGRVLEGDVILALPSSGFHSNGFSLIRRLLREKGISLGDLPFDLLVGTRIYSELPRAFDFVKACAHVTGGGLIRALRRILGEDRGYVLEFELRDEFRWILNWVEEEEALSTFNMGLGMLMFVDRTLVRKVMSVLPDVLVVGRVTSDSTLRKISLL